MPSILLVEDEEVIRAGIRQLIGSLPGQYTITEAEHGRAALDRLRHEVPVLLITDIRMREMDGLALISAVRELYADLPILIISGYSEFSYAQQALRFGVRDYLLKPVNRQAFILCLENILGIRRTVSEHERADASTDSPGPDRSPGFGEHHVIAKVKRYIASNIEKDLSLQKLSETVHLNAAYLSHLFKQETDMNLSDYITRMRIERAKYLLRETPFKIYDIAQLSGYQSPKHFMLVFKQQVGATPSAYRDEVCAHV